MREISLPELKGLLVGVVGDTPQMESLKESSGLLGYVRELDSMAIVNLILGIEQRFGVVLEDDELDASVFDTVGSLLQFIRAKCSDADH